MIMEVVVASTSRFQRHGPVGSPKDAEDISGEVILERLKAAGWQASYRLVPDGVGPIRDALAESRSDAIIICGGTGLTSLDQTIEAVEPMLEKTIPGFGEIFRMRSLEEVGTRAMLTRACAGIHCGRPVFCLPGSPGAARLGIELILAEIDHILGHIRD